MTSASDDKMATFQLFFQWGRAKDLSAPLYKRYGSRETAVLCRGLEKNIMVGACHGHGMASVNQTRPHCVNQMGKTHSKPLAVRHGRGRAWARHGHGMLYVNRPLESVMNHEML
jgi:hypothetical protein